VNEAELANKHLLLCSIPVFSSQPTSCVTWLQLWMIAADYTLAPQLDQFAELTHCNHIFVSKTDSIQLNSNVNT